MIINIKNTVQLIIAIAVVSGCRSSEYLFKSVPRLAKSETVKNDSYLFYGVLGDSVIIDAQKFERFISVDSTGIILDGYFNLKESDTLLFVPFYEYTNNCYTVKTFAVLNRDAEYLSYPVENHCLTIKYISSDISIQNNFNLIENKDNELFIVRHLVYQHMEHEFDDNDILTRIFQINKENGILSIVYDKKHEEELLISFPYIKSENRLW